MMEILDNNFTEKCLKWLRCKYNSHKYKKNTYYRNKVIIGSLNNKIYLKMDIYRTYAQNISELYLCVLHWNITTQLCCISVKDQVPIFDIILYHRSSWLYFNGVKCRALLQLIFIYLLDAGQPDVLHLHCVRSFYFLRKK